MKNGEIAMNLDDIRTVVTPEDLARVGRFRYEIYVQEQGKNALHVDHENRTLIEPEDRDVRSQIYWIESEGRILGTVRTQFGPFAPDFVESMQLHRLPFDPSRELFLFTRMMVAEDARRTEITTKLFRLGLTISITKNITAGILACAPRLVPVFESFGCLAYADTFVHSIAGPQVPMAVLGESDYMRERGSPLADWIQALRPLSVYTRRFLECVNEHRKHTASPPVRSARRLTADTI